MSEFYREYFTPGVYIDTAGYPYHPEFPRFLEDRPAPPRIPGQLELNVSTTKLPTLTKVVTGFTLAGALWGIEHWARPTLRASKLEQKAGVWGWLQAALDTITGFLDHGTNYVGHEVSKGAAHSAHGPTHTLNVMAMRWEQLTWNVAFLTRQLELMFRRLRFHVIPREIRKQTTPIKAEQRRLKVGLATVTADENALRHWIHSQLNRHVYPRLGRVETKVNHTLPQRIRRGEKLCVSEKVMLASRSTSTAPLPTRLEVMNANPVVEVRLITPPRTNMLSFCVKLISRRPENARESVVPDQLHLTCK